MLPRRFNLHRPERIADAVALLAEYGDDASPYAGGTELLIAMKARVLSYAHIVDLKGIAELRGVCMRGDGGLSIGPLSTHHALANDPLVRERLPAYAKLSANVANIRVRATGTLGGNLCFAEPHADPPAMLCALNAELVLASPAGERRMLLRDFVLGELSTARATDEILVRIEVPGLPAGTRAGYRAFGHLERPAVGVAAVAVPLAKGYDWRLRVGSICGRPTALPDLERAMRGLPADDALAILAEGAEEAAAHVEADDDIRGSAEYKRHLVGVLARRAARAALGMEEFAA
jgi:aerobic carbon-monoxide dehydrogenase medium subunit